MSQKYYPYFRGRQFELIALREMIDDGVLSQDIVPIVEPVKVSSTLISTFDRFCKAKRDIAIVVNPEYGSFLDEVMGLPDNRKKEVTEVLRSENVHHAILQNSMMERIIEMAHERIKLEEGRWLAVYTNGEYLDKSLELCERYGIHYETNLIPDGVAFRRRIRTNRISFRDVFRKQPRNSDYQNQEDELFTEEHCYAVDEKYDGTGDYSIVGSDYVDSGFAPYAVAIHIVYLGEKGALRVRHFVSDSNDGIDDPAGKFKEAASKAVKWIAENKSKCPITCGLSQLIDAYEHGMYPGLGSVKKFTIMHHLELMGQILHDML